MLKNIKSIFSCFPHIDRLLAIVVFFTSFTVYLLTLAPTIYIEDAAEFAAAVPTLGITHPSGFPLYMLLAISFLWCLAKWRETKDLPFIYFLVFLMGLSLANHLSIIVYFPGIAFFILLFC